MYSDKPGMELDLLAMYNFRREDVTSGHSGKVGMQSLPTFSRTSDGDHRLKNTIQSGYFLSNFCTPVCASLCELSMLRIVCCAKQMVADSRGGQDNVLELWSDAPRWEYSTAPLMDWDSGDALPPAMPGSHGHALHLNDQQAWQNAQHATQGLKRSTSSYKSKYFR